jgi:hypothetical protein
MVFSDKLSFQVTDTTLVQKLLEVPRNHTTSKNWEIAGFFLMHQTAWEPLRYGFLLALPFSAFIYAYVAYLMNGAIAAFSIAVYLSVGLPIAAICLLRTTARDVAHSTQKTSRLLKLANESANIRECYCTYIEQPLAWIFLLHNGTFETFLKNENPKNHATIHEFLNKSFPQTTVLFGKANINNCTVHIGLVLCVIIELLCSIHYGQQTLREIRHLHAFQRDAGCNTPPYAQTIAPTSLCSLAPVIIQKDNQTNEMRNAREVQVQYRTGQTQILHFDPREHADSFYLSLGTKEAFQTGLVVIYQNAPIKLAFGKDTLKLQDHPGISILPVFWLWDISLALLITTGTTLFVLFQSRTRS